MEETIKINIPAKVEGIIKTLEKAGYEAYIVGGCVRDSLLMLNPHDWDITTSARPEEVKALFYRTIDTGLKHGTVSVLMDGRTYEVTTYRVDGAYLDGRHPSEVSFTSLLVEDLKRRDFTINAMAYHPDRGLVDLFGGRKDLNDRVICCVGNARERFEEDSLRMMRAVRFMAQLQFGMDEATRDAVQKLAPTLSRVSNERIREEMMKILTSDHPEYFLELYELGLTAQFFPEFDRLMSCEQNTKYHCYTVGMHTLKVMEHTPNDPVVRLAALLHDVGKLYAKTTDEAGIDHFYGHEAVSEKRAREILRTLRFDNDTIKKVCTLVKYHDAQISIDACGIRRLIGKVGKELFPQLVTLMRADMCAKSAYAKKQMSIIDRIWELYQECLKNGDCTSLKELAVKGDDLIRLGIPSGAQIGQILEALLNEVIEDPKKNDKKILLAMASDMMAGAEK